MQCHRCPYRQAVQDGVFKEVPFDQTPCGICELRQSSVRSMALDHERSPFIREAERAEVPPDQGGDGVHVDCPFPEEVQEPEPTLPVDVLQEFVVRLLSLPQDVRDVVCWRFIGLTYPEIAAKQGLTIAGAEARHERAMRMFPELRELFIFKTARQRMRLVARAHAPETGDAGES